MDGSTFWLNFFQTLLSLAAAALFVWAAGAGVLRFAKGDEEETTRPVDKKAVLAAGLLCFAACAAGTAFFAVFGLHKTPGAPLEQALQSVFPTSMDADHYLKLAEYGYGPGEAFPEQYLMIVFYPLFPWLVRLVHGITGGGLYTVGMLMQPALYGCGGAALYALYARHCGRENAAWALAFFAALPAAFFCAAPMTESLYLATAAWAFLALDTQKPGAFAAFGFLAALTRATGLLLAGTAGIYWLELCRAGTVRKKRWPWLAACGGPAAGFAVYLGLNRFYYGSWTAFAYFEREHWHFSLGTVPATVRYLVYYLISWWNSNRTYALYVSLAGLVCIFVQLGLLAACRRNLPLPWLGYGLVYVAVTDGATWLISAPRYLLSMLFVPAGLALRLPRRWQKLLCLAVELVLAALYLKMYLAWGPIY